MFSQEKQPWCGPEEKQTNTATTTTNKRYRCHHCRYATNRRNNLQRHVQAMHSQPVTPLRCCDTDFPNKATLRQHTQACHREGYQCQECKRVFCRKALLRRHFSVHSGVREHVCDKCDYATSHKSNLERHKKVHERTSFVSDKDILNQETIDLKEETVNTGRNKDTISSVTSVVSEARVPVLRPIPRMPQCFTQGEKTIAPFEDIIEKQSRVISNAWVYPSIFAPPPSVSPADISLISRCGPSLSHRFRGAHNFMPTWCDCPLCCVSLDVYGACHSPYFVPNALRHSKGISFPPLRHLRTETRSLRAQETLILDLGGKDAKTNAKLPLKKRDIAF